MSIAIRRLMVLLLGLGLAAPALADPTPLRRGGEAAALILDAGTTTLAVGTWLGPHLGLAADLRLPRSALGLSAGTRWTLHRLGQRGTIDTFLAGGLLLPTHLPGLALTVTPALQLAHRGSRLEVGVGLVFPLELGLLPRAALRLPMLLEVEGGIRAGPIRVGLRAATGAVLVTGGATTFALEASLWLCLPLPL